MKIFNILLLTFVFSSTLFSQTLFENVSGSSQVTSNVQAVTIKADSNPTPNVFKPLNKASKPKSTGSRPKRYVSTNLESLILRGDIQVAYETPQQTGWSSVLLLHVNPQSEFNDSTGDVGVLGGGRMYFDEKFLSSDVYLQGLAGFNHFDDWDLMISVEIGQRFKWKQGVFIDLAFAVNRSYADNKKDPMAYIKTNITFALDQPLVPFL
ncbi:MAG: hypothetical protein VXX85_05215 [Candidatus Margulisiibacteriota bacterium]|nr:hypothetical protein [Candidatus Margulisiibacteriota bacterium]